MVAKGLGHAMTRLLSLSDCARRRGVVWLASGWATRRFREEAGVRVGGGGGICLGAYNGWAVDGR